MEYLIGLILPPLVDVVNKDVKNSNWRFVIAVIVSILAAIAVSFPKLSHESYLDLIKSASIVFAESQVIFKLYYEDSFVREKITAKLGSKDATPSVSDATTSSPSDPNAVQSEVSKHQ